MFNPSRILASLVLASSLSSFPFAAMAQEADSNGGNDSTDNQLTACLQTALALNDSGRVRDCDRYNRGSLSFGQSARGNGGGSIY